ncbi:2,3-bisphosphoglycerate-independent phosphoglycerate mutase [Emticicia oligotrophica DSM 17448]|uniref:2,3-bisphosphoglycerate-independent phosphoglycerate mutase n=1 Tax=Emticicia oligotrophica (strain DSM 17448 / CIP 109782 / MTCC 6937 / GPTSA100-15) TaxID=929562 RepID=A0ABM5N3Q0_EMTOG|nr:MULTISPECIES: 2,3-bisphosphoglycerate-independent phosphoglycerate mutase [Emticicia]AFK04068.1 2,3-bisphosphoglycerate-independent phosphoglycerate mutase [Emticicia oligotrophica DSM 17448]
MNKKVVLIILDGWGIPKKGEEWRSAIEAANVPYFRKLMSEYPNSTLEACGRAVGLPNGQMGNSEVGHMNLGAGRVVYQELEKINIAVEEGKLAKEPVLVEAFEYAKNNGKKVHFIGLVSDGGVHSHIFHVKGLVQAAADYGLSDVYVHAFTDGRDCDPKSGKGFLADLQATLDTTGGKLASVTGRYYAMDRDKRWERVKLTYDVMVNGVADTKIAIGELTDTIQKSYEENVTDEFLKPIVITENGAPVATIAEGDVVMCFNFRTDRGREITEVLTQKDFPDFGMKALNLYYLTMTNYDETYKNVKVIYEKDNLNNTLGEVLERAKKKQIRIAETEKYPHVTFFFSGGHEQPFVGESRLLCPSPKDVATYDLKPQMAAYDIDNAILPELEKGEVDFVCLNFANPDMVGHTGVFEAVVTAVEAVDKCLEQVVETGLANGYTSIVIADHGNADYMINDDKTPNTQHSLNLVPCIVVDKNDRFDVKDGKLGDIAPTILKLMGVEIPAEMTGNVLI